MQQLSAGGHGGSYRPTPEKAAPDECRTQLPTVALGVCTRGVLLGTAGGCLQTYRPGLQLALSILCSSERSMGELPAQAQPAQSCQPRQGAAWGHGGAARGHWGPARGH